MFSISMQTDQQSNKEMTSTNVALEYLPSGAAVIRLGQIGEKVVKLDKERLESLKNAIEKIRQERPPGLILTGPGGEMFTAGADINLIARVDSAELGEKLATVGQEIFNLLENLPFLTVAAISGPCVGGGCEMALACDYRIISDNKNSVIGLPEIKLGILPGFGGTQRLPRLIGLPRALNMILAGKTLRPKQALKLGLVNEIVPGERLLEHAGAIVAESAQRKSFRVGIVDRLLTYTSIGRSVVRKQSLKQITKETKGFYPAPAAALECAIYGLEHGLQKGLQKEAQELGRLIVTPESKSLVRIFFLTEEAKSIGKSARPDVEHIQAVVVGAGVMGAGIAGVLAKSDCGVIMKDVNDDALKRGMNQIKEYLSKIRHLSDQERSFVLNRIETTSGLSSNVGNANLAIEAIVEKLEVKKKVLGELAGLMPQDSIIATNTSSLSVTEISDAIPNPERVVGMHFFNPVPKMPLIEIVRGKQTSNRAVAIVAALTSKLGKYPIVVNDVPGFLVNRILSPYLNEAAYLLEEFDVADIDRAATKFGLPMGPLRLLDEVGLDVVTHVSEIMQRGYGERMRGPNYAAQLVMANRLGRKTGQGFYVFEEEKVQPDESVRELLKLKPASTPKDSDQLQERLVFTLINEAVLC
ncbi:MAG: enoyl-CoA hydratase/isomerase family protein, partial [Bdellovibrionales bacterium]|nr:enoyl-CoA hydratase/isomerase family protein [Bdellovibrionales bacterium]